METIKYFETIKCEDFEIFNLEYHNKRVSNTIGLNINLLDDLVNILLLFIESYVVPFNSTTQVDSPSYPENANLGLIAYISVSANTGEIKAIVEVGLAPFWNDTSLDQSLVILPSDALTLNTKDVLSGKLDIS